MPNRSESFNRLGQSILKLRWVVILFLGLAIIALELNERYQLHDFSFDTEFLFLVLIVGIMLPSLTGYLMGLVERATLEKHYAVLHLSHKESLSKQINTAPGWNELVKIIVEFPRTVIPLVGSVLVLYDASTSQFEQAGIWGFYGVPLPSDPPYRSGNACRDCASKLSSKYALVYCDCSGHDLPDGSAGHYSLPLVHANQIIGMLDLYIPGNAPLSAEQVRLLNSLAVEMAMALDAAGNKKMNTLIKENAEAERQRIARELHDNLAQSLIYLRHRLDRLTDGDALIKISSLQQDLEKMRDVVDEAYIGVRSTLKEIETHSTIDLAKMAEDYVHSFRNQAGFTITISSSGRSRPVRARLARQTLYILGEIMANIEKHAGAHHAEVKLDWQPDFLALSVSDDGAGFDPAANNTDEHMGLGIMQDRANEIKGTLQIISEVGSGTEVIFKLPLAPIPEAMLTYENISR